MWPSLCTTDSLENRGHCCLCGVARHTHDVFDLPKSHEEHTLEWLLLCTQHTVIMCYVQISWPRRCTTPCCLLTDLSSPVTCTHTRTHTRTRSFVLTMEHNTMLPTCHTYTDELNGLNKAIAESQRALAEVDSGASRGGSASGNAPALAGRESAIAAKEECVVLLSPLQCTTSPTSCARTIKTIETRLPQHV